MMKEITFHVEVADLEAFQRHHRRTSPQMRRVRVFIWLVYGALSLEYALRAHPGGPEHRVVYFFVMLGLMAILSFVFVRIVRWIVDFRAFQNAERHGILGEHTITLTPETIRERTAVNDLTSKWSGILKIDATATHFFIFIQPNAAHVIPRRAFPSPADAEEFLATARAYREAAISPVAAAAP